MVVMFIVLMDARHADCRPSYELAAAATGSRGIIRSRLVRREHAIFVVDNAFIPGRMSSFIAT
jgi:hypothetical protein